MLMVLELWVFKLHFLLEGAKFGALITNQEIT